MTIIFRSKKLGIFKRLYLGIVFLRKIQHSPVRLITDDLTDFNVTALTIREK